MSADAIFLSIYIVCFVGLIACGWLLYHNSCTYKERSNLLEAVFRQDNYAPYLRAFNEVDYDKHLWARAKLRDWRKLYSPEIRKVSGL